MILTCPACTTRYLVDAGAIGVGGRQVRCAKCGREWRQAPAAADILPPGDGSGSDAALVEEITPPPISPPEGIRPLPPGSNLPALPQSRSSTRGWLAWAALVMFLAIGTSAAVIWRQAVVAHWPPAGKLYELVQLEVAPPEIFAFDIRDVASKVGFEGGQRILKVSGQVVNVGPEAKSVPRLRVMIIDDDDRPLFNWTVAMPTRNIAPGEATPFTTRLPDPPKNVKRISVTFEA